MNGPFQKRIIIRLFTALLLAGAALSLWLFWQDHVRHPSTNDLYVEADLLAIAARVAGPVVTVHVADNQKVKTGDPLFEIDPTDFQKALNLAEANLAMAKLQFDVATRAIAASEDVVAAKLAELDNNKLNLIRAQSLLESGAGTRQEFDNQNEKMLTAQADLKAAQEALEQIRIERGTTESNPRILAAEAARDEAALQLSYTKIVAPVDGWITNLNLPVGTFVQAGERRITIIADGTWRIAANYKETDLRLIAPGMRAEVRLKMYPDKIFTGRVQGIAWAIAQENLTDAVVPRINPTLDWVRLAQRFPVRIQLDDPPIEHVLRVGSTGFVRILREPQ